MKKFKSKEAGFTIVEVLVTSVVFSIIALTVSAIFVQALNLQRRGAASQKIQNNALLVLESMSRDIRVSSISDQESPSCTATTITLDHPVKGIVAYRLNNGVVEKNESGSGYVPISGTNVNFSRLNYCIVGSLQDDNKTPKVTIISTIESIGGREVIKINIQTTVSSRDTINEFQFQ